MSVRRTLAAVTAVLLVGVASPVLLAVPASAAVDCDLGGFEIDGDLPSNCVPTPHDDWATVGVTPQASGGTYSASSKDVSPTSGWVAGGSAPDKASIDTVYTYARTGEDGHYYLYVGWTRTSNTGTGKYAIELTFAGPNVVPTTNDDIPTPQPIRSQGGVVAYIDFDGSDLPELGQLCDYDNQETYPDDVNDADGCTDDTSGFASAISANGVFFEVGFDLTEMADITPACPPDDTAATMYIRSITGGSGNGNLKAFMDPVGVTPPSTCGFLEVTKESLNDLALDDTTEFAYEVGVSGEDPIVDGELQLGDKDEYFDIEPGDGYTLTETIPEDAPWSVWSIVCTAGGEDYVLVDDGEPLEQTFPVETGQTTSCVITNATSFVEVEKQTLPDDSSKVFDFTITDGQAFDLSDGESQTFQYRPDTSVTVAETVPTGWDLDDITCDTGATQFENSVTVGTQAGGTVACTFTNQQRGTIVIAKVVDGVSEGIFDFTSAQLGPFQIPTAEGIGSTSFHNLKAGEYAVTESPETGFDTTNLVCNPEADVTIEGATVTIDLAPGETVVCTYTNTERGKIVVQKATEPADYDQEFAFTFNGNADFTLNAAGDAEWDTGLIPPGSYTVTENAIPSGWTLDDISCGERDGATTTIDLAPGAIVTCLFTNVATPGAAVVSKIVSGVDESYPWSFDFILTEEPDGAPITRTVDNGDLPASAIAVWENLTVGKTYTLVEDTLPFGWTAEAIGCVGIADADDEAEGFQFVVTPGFVLECVVDNQAIPADVELTKTVSGVNPGIEWAFEFTLDGESRTATNTEPVVGWDGLIPGVTYTILEEPTPGWGLDGIVCWVEGAKATLPDADTEEPGFQFEATPGMVLICEVDNPADPGELTVTKWTVGGNGTFDFVLTRLDDEESWTESLTTVDGTGSATFADILPGYAYSIEESAPPANWVAGVLECEITPAEGEPFGVDAREFWVAPGDEIACEITNRYQAMPVTGGGIPGVAIALALMLIGGGAAVLLIRIRTRPAP